jgi:hypothetical protein
MDDIKRLVELSIELSIEQEKATAATAMIARKKAETAARKYYDQIISDHIDAAKKIVRLSKSYIAKNHYETGRFVSRLLKEVEKRTASESGNAEYMRETRKEELREWIIETAWTIAAASHRGEMQIHFANSDAAASIESDVSDIIVHVQTGDNAETKRNIRALESSMEDYYYKRLLADKMREVRKNYEAMEIATQRAKSK